MFSRAITVYQLYSSRVFFTFFAKCLGGVDNIASGENDETKIPTRILEQSLLHLDGILTLSSLTSLHCDLCDSPLP